VEARGRTSCKVPTADDLVSSISCSNPRFGVRSLFWWVSECGLQLQRVPWRADDGQQQALRKGMDDMESNRSSDLGKTKNSRSTGLLVIFLFFGVLSVIRRLHCAIV